MTRLVQLADGVEKVVRPVARVGIIIGMVSLVIMVLLLVADTIGRFGFRNPIPGIKEMEEFLLVLIGFLGLAYVGLSKAHVRVDLIMSKFPTWVGHVVDTVTGLISLTLWVLIAWKTFGWAIRIIGPPTLNSEVLGIPKAPFVFIAVLGIIVFWFVLIVEILRSIDGAIAEGGKKAFWILPGMAAIGGIAFIALNVELPVSGLIMGVLGIGFLIVLLFLRMPVGFAMGFVGLVGAWYFMGLEAGLGRLETTPYYTAAFFYLVVLPLFLLMGTLCFHAGISRDLYETCYAWLGRLPGGLASATVAGCAGFAAICGSSSATTAAMGRVALPEMRRFNYADSLACGVVAAGGTLGILIPPSMGFIFYAIITEQSIGKLFIAGIIPGILLSSLFIITITIGSKLNPKLGPPGPSTTWKQKLFSLRGIGAVLALFLLVIGGIYMGVFTVIEAGAIGALGAFLIMVIKRRFSFKNISAALMDTGKIVSMFIAILIGVYILGYFLAASEVPLQLAAAISALEVNRYIILALILFVYVILGCLMNILPMIILTLPIFWPTILILGFDPIWFGVIMVIMMEMGQITPPIGMNVFLIAGIAEDVPLGTIFKGIVPFVLAEVVIIVILTAFPQIALWLPSIMYR